MNDNIDPRNQRMIDAYKASKNPDPAVVAEMQAIAKEPPHSGTSPKKVLCHACSLPIKVEDLAGVVKLDDKEAWFHKQLPCLLEFETAMGGTSDKPDNACNTRKLSECVCGTCEIPITYSVPPATQDVRDQIHRVIAACNRQFDQTGRYEGDIMLDDLVALFERFSVEARIDELKACLSEVPMPSLSYEQVESRITALERQLEASGEGE